MKVTATRGFSLIEVLIVIAILAVVLTIATPTFSKYRQNTNLRETTRSLAADIALYKQKAAAENKRYQITFNQGANNYTIKQESPANSGTYVNLVPSVTKSPSAISSLVTISGITFPGTPPQIIFQPRGTITMGAIGTGSVTLKNGLGSTGTITTNLAGRMYVNFIYQ